MLSEITFNLDIYTSDCVPTWFGKGACDICRRYETSAQAINQNSYKCK